MNSTIARLQRVSLSYGRLQVLDGFTLDLPEGCFVTLLGPSGCGKSTILRLLGGFIRPEVGAVWLDGQDVTRLPPERRNVNMVFQDYALFPHLTVGGNVAFGLKKSGLSSAAMNESVRRLLDLVRLNGLGERMPDQLSGGQRQRVALARALARDPRLLLLDEPLGALDAPLRAEMQVELRALQRRTGKTFLLVTHDQAEAMAVSDLIIVLNDGRIEQIGTPEELYGRPRTRFVAGFLGENNIVRCRIEHADAMGATLSWRGQRFVVTQSVGRQSGEMVEVAVRPQSVRCTLHASGCASPSVGRVRDRTFRGNSVLLSLEMPGGESVLATEEPGGAYAIGEAVEVAFDRRFIWVLDCPHDSRSGA